MKGGRRQGSQKKKEKVGRQHRGMDRRGVRHVPEGSGEQGRMEETGCEIICGAPTTLAVKEQMVMMKGYLRHVYTQNVSVLCLNK